MILVALIASRRSLEDCEGCRMFIFVVECAVGWRTNHLLLALDRCSRVC